MTDDIHSHIDLTNHPLFERQLELEEEMRTLGIRRYRARLEKAQEQHQMTGVMSVNRLVSASHERMVEAIKAFLEEAGSGKAGRRHAAVSYFKKLDADVLANLTTRTVLNELGRMETLPSVAIQLGTMLEHEVNSGIFVREMPKAHRKFLQKANKENLARRKWSHLLYPAKLLGVQLEEWEVKDRLLVGEKLIELFAASTGLIRVRLVESGRNGTVYMIETTEETLKWFEEENNRLEILAPTLMPTIVPPKPWTTPFDGGYYTTLVNRHSLVKTSNRQYLEELADRDLSEVYEAVNALQETPWAINLRVLDVIETLYSSNSGIVDIPKSKKIEAPERPLWLPTDRKMKKEEMTPEQVEEFNDWKARTYRTHQENAKMQRQRMVFLRCLSVAQRMKEEEAIYFPHQLDWRGRAYPMPLYLTPQGNDLQRGILEFANAAAIEDQEAADWLAIHGAGCFGYDKVSLAARVQWVLKHEAEILASAADPYDNRFWTEADKPWQFLAFCFDWAGFKAEGFGYLSNLPIQMDGTCNGLQNFSAMLKDEIGGAAVNLIPAETPQDIYQRVADIVMQKIEEDLHSEEPVISKLKRDDGTEAEIIVCTVGEIARGWAGNVNRKVTKRPVMTLAYGARRFGFVAQVEEDTIKPWRENKPESYPFVRLNDDGKSYDFGYKAAQYMGDLIWNSVGEVVVAARSAMDWLQEVSKIASKEGLPINWTTPTGFLVQQAYRVPDLKRVETTFNSQRIRLSYRAGEGKIDSRRQAAGISPNWVHSLDASHLMKTISACRREGIKSFSMIHDSYGTHAGNAWLMARILREQFVQMYAHVDILQQFKEELEFQTGEKLPSVPASGNLDLSVVLDSPFFFA